MFIIYGFVFLLCFEAFTLRRIEEAMERIEKKNCQVRIRTKSPTNSLSTTLEQKNFLLEVQNLARIDMDLHTKDKLKKRR